MAVTGGPAGPEVGESEAVGECLVRLRFVPAKATPSGAVNLLESVAEVQLSHSLSNAPVETLDPGFPGSDNDDTLCRVPS